MSELRGREPSQIEDQRRVNLFKRLPTPIAESQGFNECEQEYLNGLGRRKDA